MFFVSIALVAGSRIFIEQPVKKISIKNTQASPYAKVFLCINVSSFDTDGV